MYNKIIELGIREAKFGKNTDVYGWKHIYDFMGYANLRDTKLRFLANNPFIFRRIVELDSSTESKNKKKLPNVISFYDALGLLGCNLNNAAKLIDKEKIEYNIEDIEKLGLIDKNIKNGIFGKQEYELIKYNQKDAELVLDLVIKIKKVLKEYGLNPRHIISIGQISTNCVFNEIKNGDKAIANTIFKGRFMNKIYQPSYKVMELQTYGGRGGRFEVFEFGDYENATEIDLNSAYSYADTNIRFPDLRSLEIIESPLEVMDYKEIIKYIGMSKCVLKHDNFEGIGIVPIIFKHQQVFPDNKKQILIGTWTHQELEYFIENGYKIEHIFYSIYYKKEIENPFKKIVPKIYEFRKKGKLENVLFKRVLNFLTGKMKQRRKKIETIFVNREDAYKYEAKGFKKINWFGNLFLMEKKSDKYEFGKFFIGQVYADITAKIRIKITKAAKLIDKEDLIYIPCDALIIKNFEKYKDKFRISDNMGDFKVEIVNESGKVYSKQQYSIADKVLASGVINANKQKTEFDKGEVTTYKMINWKKDLDRAGEMVEEKRNMYEATNKMKNILEKLKNKKVIVSEPEFDDKVIEYIKKEGYKWI